MTLRAPRLSFALDPLIAEAKRRARRRRALLAAAVVLVLAAGGTAAAAFFPGASHSAQAVPVGPVRVLVATRWIVMGTTGDAIRTNGHFKTVSVPRKLVEAGAILSPATLTGRVALQDIAPGQQVTKAQFGPCGCTWTAGPGGRLNVTVPLSPSDTVGRGVTPGSHVEIWVDTSRGKPRLLYHDMYVVALRPATATLRATPPHSGNLVYITGHRNYRLVLRLHK